MRRLFQTLSKDRLITRLAAALPDEAHALSAAAMTAQSAGLGPAQVRVLGPGLARASCTELMALETEPPQGPAPCAMQASVWLLLLGVLLGALFSVWLSGSVAVRTAPGIVAAVWATFGGIAGFLVGKWVQPRAGHGGMLRGIRRELRQGRWVVLVHVWDAHQVGPAEDALSRAAHGHVLRSM